MLYFSYAANLNRSHMARLCPGAEFLFPAALEGYTLTVRRWFNVEPLPGGSVCGGVWRIGEEDTHRLDWYEDSPDLYLRTYLSVLPVESMQKRGNGESGKRGENSIGVSGLPPSSGILSDFGVTGPGAGESSKGHESRQNSLECLVYVMKEPFAIPLSPPDAEYLEMVRKGYEEWGISSEQLDAALRKVSKL